MLPCFLSIDIISIIHIKKYRQNDFKSILYYNFIDFCMVHSTLIGNFLNPNLLKSLYQPLFLLKRDAAARFSTVSMLLKCSFR